MITYELAKKLIDAGFPEKEILLGDWYYEGPNGYGGKEFLYQLKDEEDQLGMSIGVTIRVPPLSELVEACGDRFYSLTQPYKNGDFEASDRPGDNFAGSVIGKTPEIAAANLWLELNKKV